MQDVVPVMSNVLIDHSADMQYLKALMIFARVYLEHACVFLMAPIGSV